MPLRRSAAPRGAAAVLLVVVAALARGAAAQTGVWVHSAPGYANADLRCSTAYDTVNQRTMIYYDRCVAQRRCVSLPLLCLTCRHCAVRNRSPGIGDGYGFLSCNTNGTGCDAEVAPYAQNRFYPGGWLLDFGLSVVGCW